MIERLIIAGLVAIVVGVPYAGLVHLVLRGDPEHPYTFLWVAIGALLSLAVAAIVVPGQWILVGLGVFCLTGAPQVAGAVYRNTAARRKAQRADARTIRETLEG